MRLVDLTPQRARVLMREIDEEASADQKLADDGRRSVWIALTVGTLALVLMEYAGTPFVLARFNDWLERTGSFSAFTELYASRWGMLLELSFWVLFRVIGFLIIPMCAIRFWIKERIVDHGLHTEGLRGHLSIYAALYLLVLPLIGLAGLREEFVRYYPFYRLASDSWFDLILWELLYALQFFSLEFFFRGFLLTSCRRALGSLAIIVMVVPYCMIHFQKPVLEVLGAIVAGVVLGLLAMRTRSIWGGVLLHVAVAVTMDTIALLQSTGLPRRLVPFTF